jgi:enterochelin esterase family protein
MTGPAPEVHLDPAPSDAGGAPLRTTPSWWSSEPTDQELSRRAALGTPVLGEVRDIEGNRMVEATFLWEAGAADHAAVGAHASPQVMVHLNSFTDNHREDIAPALLQEVPGTGWFALTYLLPADGVFSYRLVVREEPFPADVGKERAGWMAVHQAGRSDPHCRRTLSDPRYQDSSVFVGPEAYLHPDWEEGSDDPGPWTRQEFEVLDRPVALLRGSGPGLRRLLVLLDGEMWRGGDAATHLAGRAQNWDLLLVDSGTMQQRAQDLPDHERAADLVSRSIVAAASVANPEPAWATDPAHVVVAGFSFGGLAVANIVLRHPEIARTGIAQSGSYWWAGVMPQTHDVDPEAAVGGELLTWIRGRPAGELAAFPGRLVVQVGTEEGHMVAGSRALVDLLDSTDSLISFQEWRGGHDFAWWRHGLSVALDALEGTRVGTPPPAMCARSGPS